LRKFRKIILRNIKFETGSNKAIGSK